MENGMVARSPDKRGAIRHDRSDCAVQHATHRVFSNLPGASKNSLRITGEIGGYHVLLSSGFGLVG
jgi:hypothetical protein